MKLSAFEQSAISAIDKQGSVQAQGTLREIVADNYFQRNGYTVLDGKCGSGNCFDGVYVKGNTVYVNEVKPLNADGTIKLSGPTANQETQMSEVWIKGAVARLSEGTPAQKEVAATIQKAINAGNGSFVRVVTGVDSNGMTIVKLK